MISSIALGVALLAPALLSGPDAEVEWVNYHAFEDREFFWNPSETKTTTVDGREVVSVHARGNPIEEERGGEYEGASFEWRFAIDCAAGEIAILEYASGKFGAYHEWQKYSLEDRRFKPIGDPPGGSYEEELAKLVCE